MTNLKIEANIPEKQFMESLLNLKHSGCSINHISFLFFLYAFTKSWHISKLKYYMKLLEMEKII